MRLNPFSWLFERVISPIGTGAWRADLDKADRLRKEGRYDESRDVLEQLLKLYPDDRATTERLLELEHAAELDRAAGLHAGGDAAAAEALLRDLTTRHPEVPEPHLRLAWVLCDRAEYREAAAQAAAAANLAPTSLRTLAIAAEVTLPSDRETAEGYLKRIEAQLSTPEERQRHTKVLAQVARVRKLIEADHEQ